MRHTFILIISILILAGVVAGFVWWYVSSRQEPTPQEEVIEIPEWYHTDKDGDGISDTEEESRGTSPVETDTDGDTIPDQIEIESYDTDPKNPDTDGDGYADGFELLQGFSPLEKATAN